MERCLECLEETAAAQQAALERALHLTANAMELAQQSAAAAGGLPGGSDSSSAAASGGGEAADWWWRAARLRALQHMERLDTTLALHNG